ncbi:hypothetical protein M8120_27770 [Microcystis aeruginosa str. Chao 1910]|uniref:hypothetical protein n=1 Tax=Microcystis aeruginosa TaxID=1126 RepID=UPI0016812337|nr:hypothetical protein [Microcystis aeruginosa]UZO76414.1 hypothetical protein M8120_27770 [Microcystis aeruginosa str. Chao 1910]
MTVTETSADFCRSQKEKLWELLGLEETMNNPSYLTWRRLMIEVEPRYWETVYNI